jgi:asparagine synthase (glutamine-hydrolysing)
MLDSIQHRGPDDRGEYRDAASGLALGHLRLSIIDLSAASHQPMRDAESGVTLAYNGELYNFRLLRAELLSLGHRFVSQGDTEVVLRSFLEWGTECFGRFAGMFALALWDARRLRLVIARDHGATELLTSYVVGDNSPEPFYRLIGFVPTGEEDEKGERILALSLRS